MSKLLRAYIHTEQVWELEVEDDESPADFKEQDVRRMGDLVDEYVVHFEIEVAD